jgi:hypothetical protein
MTPLRKFRRCSNKLKLNNHQLQKCQPLTSAEEIKNSRNIIQWEIDLLPNVKLTVIQLA